MLLLVLLLSIPAFSSADSKKIDYPVLGTIKDLEPYEDGYWSYKLSNVNWDFPFGTNIISRLSLLNRDLQLSVYAEVRLVSSYDFDITIKIPNIDIDDVKDLEDPGSDVVQKKLYKSKTLLDTGSLMDLIGFLPYVGSVTDMAVDKHIMAGANYPCRIKGRAEVYAVFRADPGDLFKKIIGKDSDGEDVRFYTKYYIENVEPLEMDYDGYHYIYIGDEQNAVGGFGVFGNCPYVKKSKVRQHHTALYHRSYR